MSSFGVSKEGSKQGSNSFLSRKDFFFSGKTVENCVKQESERQTASVSLWTGRGAQG